MIEVYNVVFLSVYVFVTFKSAYHIQAAELMSTYSKVSRWGANNTANSTNEARSIGQTFPSQRVDSGAKRAAVIRQPIYYHSAKSSSSKIDNDNFDSVPAKGEVEERFNPKPYFDFVFDDPPKSNKPSSQSNLKKPSKPATTVKGALTDFPLSKPPADIYLSPFSSYNPPDQNSNSQDYQTDTFKFSPNNNLPQTTIPNKSKRPPSTSYGVPDLQISKPASDIESIPNYNQYLPPSTSNLNKPPLQFRPPTKLAKKPSKPYFIDSSDEEANLDTMSEYEPAMMQTPLPPRNPKPSHLNHPSKNHAMSMAPIVDDDDLSPPPEDALYGKFPQYSDHDPHDHSFYNFHHDHEVYHEIHSTAATTTSTEAPRAGHYSYYYLGRKLWYIPLYFSVYFIVYVTVLILKSIARHKIQFSHYFDKGRSAKQLNVDLVNQTVITAIEASKNKYM